jgi:hypothetical protein
MSRHNLGFDNKPGMHYQFVNIQGITQPISYYFAKLEWNQEPSILFTASFKSYLQTIAGREEGLKSLHRPKRKRNDFPPPQNNETVALQKLD